MPNWNDEEYVKRKHVVVLVHGIRTRAPWFEKVASVLRESAGVRVVLVRFGYFDLFQFLLPPLRRMPITKLRKELTSALHNTNVEKVSVIAHSFGTYAVYRVLEEEPQIVLHRLILCGSIIPRSANWNRFIGRQLDSRPLNDCGTKDVWPVIAESATWEYGASGTYGFGTEGAHDRFFPFSHSDFFNDEVLHDYWLPWIKSGEWREGPCADSASSEPKFHSPWWWVLFEKIKIRWIALATLTLFVWWAAVPEPPMTMEVVRVADYRESVCDGGGRRYVEKLDDTYRFSQVVSEYSLGAAVQREYGLDVRVVDRTTGAQLRHQDTCKNCLVGVYSYPQALQVRNRVAEVLWTWVSDQPIEPDGIAFKGRYPVTRVEFVVIPPEGLDAPRSWSSSPDENIACKESATISNGGGRFSQLRESLGWQPNNHGANVGEAREPLQHADIMRVVCSPRKARDLVTDEIHLNYTINGWSDCSVP